MSSSEAEATPETTPESRPSRGSGGTTQPPKPKRIRGPREDGWLKTYHDPGSDRNLLDSVRRCAFNPDLPRQRKFHCYCGNDVHNEHSWHVMTLDGTTVCGSCACCHRCGRECAVSSRRLVSVDGMVLCYTCLHTFGYPRQPKLRIRLENLAGKNPLRSDEAAAPSADSDQMNANNSEYYDLNVPRVDRCLFKPKEDERRRIRVGRYYDPPVRRLPNEDNPCLVPPIYLAEDSRMPQMACPVCSSIALGPSAYTVPSMARVFHKRCFRCCSCRESLSCGYQIAGIAFEFCSCEVPLVWCTRTACKADRLLHHKESRCHLGCLRPGGRVQNDSKSDTQDAQDAKNSRRRRRQGNQTASAHPSEVSGSSENQPDR